MRCDPRNREAARRRGASESRDGLLHTLHESAHEASRWWRDNARALHHTPPRVRAARVVVVVIVVVVVFVVVAVVPARRVRRAHAPRARDARVVVALRYPTRAFVVGDGRGWSGVRLEIVIGRRQVAGLFIYGRHSQFGEETRS